MFISFTGPDGFRADVNNLGMYSDGTPMIKTDDFQAIINHANSMTLRSASMAHFVAAMFLYDALRWEDAPRMNLVMPYIPGARQDRVNVDGDVLFTAHSVAWMVGERDFRNLVVLDPHSPVFKQSVLSRLLNFVEYPLDLVAAKMWHGYTGIIAADKGGKGRAEQFAKAMNLPIFYGGKTRDVTNGKLTGFTLDTGDDWVQGGHYLVVDDICDGGGTFVGLAQKIAENGGYADLYVSHGLFTKGTDELKKHYKNIYTTDSHEVREGSQVSIIKVVEDMENYCE